MSFVGIFVGMCRLIHFLLSYIVRVNISNATSEPPPGADSTTVIGEQYGHMGQQEELSVGESELAAIQELNFAFRRAASRLLEMSSEHYIRAWEQRYMR